MASWFKTFSLKLYSKRRWYFINRAPCILYDGSFANKGEYITHRGLIANPGSPIMYKVCSLTRVPGPGSLWLWASFRFMMSYYKNAESRCSINFEVISAYVLLLSCIWYRFVHGINMIVSFLCSIYNDQSYLAGKWIQGIQRDNRVVLMSDFFTKSLPSFRMPLSAGKMINGFKWHSEFMKC